MAGTSVTRVVKYILKGEKGEKGASLRGPQSWSDCDLGYSFQAGGDGDDYRDVVMYGDNYYTCTKDHVKTATNYPTSTEDSNNGYWALGDKVDLIATKILLATYALVKNLGVEAIDMKDADGNIIFQAKDGAVTCKTGTFDDVVVQSGKIAGFKISGNGLTNEGFNNDAYITFRNDPQDSYASIGSNVYPPSSLQRCVAVFKNELASTQGKNIALLLYAKNAAYNLAFAGEGNGFINGAIEGFMVNEFAPASGNNGIDISNGKYVVLYGTYGLCYLPTLTSVRNALAISTSTHFAIKLTVVGGSGTSTTVHGYRDGTYGDTDCPRIMDQNYANITSGIAMTQGDSIDFLLHFDGDYYFAHIINRYY